MTKDDARVAVEEELRRRGLTKPMSATEMLMFCQEMYGRLDFRSNADRLSDIRGWAERWQMTWIREQ